MKKIVRIPLGTSQVQLLQKLNIGVQKLDFDMSTNYMMKYRLIEKVSRNYDDNSAIFKITDTGKETLKFYKK